jgi:hypothetical protein
LWPVASKWLGRLEMQREILPKASQHLLCKLTRQRHTLRHLLCTILNPS